MTTVNKFSFENQNRANSLRDNMIDAIIDAVDFSPFATAGEIVAEYLGNKGLREYAHSQPGGIASFEGGSALVRLDTLVSLKAIDEAIVEFEGELKNLDVSKFPALCAELLDVNNSCDSGQFGHLFSVDDFQEELLEVIESGIVEKLKTAVAEL